MHTNGISDGNSDWPQKGYWSYGVEVNAFDNPMHSLGGKNNRHISL